MSPNPADEEQIKHFYAVRIEHLKAAFMFVEKGALSLFLLNGGAVLATLSFIAALWSKGETAVLPTVSTTKALLGLPIWAFCLGLIFTTFLYIGSYYAQLQYFNNKYESAKIAHYLGYLFAFLSIASFIGGILFCAIRISNILS